MSYVKSLTSSWPFQVSFSLLCVIALFFLSSCGSSNNRLTADDFKGLRHRGDSATISFDEAVPDTEQRWHCDGTTFTKPTCTSRPTTYRFATEGDPVDGSSMAKTLNKRLGLDNMPEHADWTTFWGPITWPLMWAYYHFPWGLIFLILSLIALWLLLRRRPLSHEDRERLRLIDGQVQALRNDVTNGFARMNAPRIPTPEIGGTTGITTSRDIEKIDVNDGKIHLKLDAHGLRFPIIVTSDDGTGKKHTLTIGSGRYQTPADAGSGVMVPPTSEPQRGGAE